MPGLLGNSEIGGIRWPPAHASEWDPCRGQFLNKPGGMPPPLAYRPLDVSPMMRRVPRHLPAMAVCIAGPTGGHDIAFRIPAAIAARVEMLGRTLQAPRLAQRQMVGRRKQLRRTLPHGIAAIEAVTGLAMERASAQACEWRGHELSCVRKISGDIETRSPSRHTREPADSIMLAPLQLLAETDHASVSRCRRPRQARHAQPWAVPQRSPLRDAATIGTRPWTS